MTVNEYLQYLIHELGDCSDSPAADAKFLLAKALGVTPGALLAKGHHALEDPIRLQVEPWLERRKRGEPVAYILGMAGFWTFELRVDSTTLIPRPESELFVEYLLDVVGGENCQCADWGTGSGALAIALALEKQSWTLFASDISDKALEVATENARRLGAEVQFLKSDWGEAYSDASLDIVVANPPYIPESDPHLNQGDLRFEPRSALASGADGLNAIRKLISDAQRCLKTRGLLLIEHGYDQGQAVDQLLGAAGFDYTLQLRDLAGHARITLGRLG